MASTPVQGPPPYSLDVHGLSVATSSRTPASDRAGSVYDPESFAGAAPVWFHPCRRNGRYVALLSSRLTAAAPVPTVTDPAAPVLYLDAVSSGRPCWAVVDGPSGGRGPVRDVPSLTPGERTMTGAASRGDFLFVLNRLASGGALLQHLRVSPSDELAVLAEEKVPRDLAYGLYAGPTHLWVFGSDGQGHLTAARRDWSRIGASVVGAGWQFRAPGGWHPDPDVLVPFTTASGSPVPAHGPCSVARDRDTYHFAVTTRVAAPAGAPAAAQQSATATEPPAPAWLLADLVGGVVNGFVTVGPGVAALFSRLLSSLTLDVTGSPAQSDPLASVSGFLSALVDAASAADEAAELLSQALSAVVPPVASAVDLAAAAAAFIDSSVASTLGSAPAGQDSPARILTETLVALAPPSLSVSPPAAAAEGDPPGTRNARFTVTLSRAATTTVTVAYVTADGTATAGQDYTAASGTVTFQPGSTSEHFDVTVTGDAAVEADETFTATLSSPTGGATLARSTATATISNDDTAWAYEARTYTARELDGSWTPAGSPIPLGGPGEYNGGGVYLQEQVPLATGNLTVRSSAGVTVLDVSDPATVVVTGSATHTVVLPSTARPEGSSTRPDGVVVVPQGRLPVLSVADSRVTEGDPPGTAELSFTVTAEPRPDVDVGFSYSVTAGTAQAGLDFVAASGTAVLPGGQASRTITVAVVADRLPEPWETLTVTISSPTGATLGRAQATGTVVDDDPEVVGALADDLRNLLNGLAAGTVAPTPAVVSAVSALLSSAAATVLGFAAPAAGFAGTVAALVDAVSQPGLNPTGWVPSLASAAVAAVGATSQQGDLAQAALRLLEAVAAAAPPDDPGVLLRQLFLAAAGQPGTPPTDDETDDESPAVQPPPAVAYAVRTVHNQSTADVTVMASSRDGTVRVPAGSGMTFRPYKPDPVMLRDWSWSFASERAPTGRVGFPYVSTARVTGDGGASGLLTRWGFLETPRSPAPAAAPSPTPAVPVDAPALASLLTEVALVLDAVGSGSLAPGAGAVSTVSSAVSSALAAAGASRPALDVVSPLVSGLLREVASGGSQQSVSDTLENLFRQATGGTGLLGGTTLGQQQPTLLQLVQGLSEVAAGVAGAVEQVADLFADIVSSITR